MKYLIFIPLVFVFVRPVLLNGSFEEFSFYDDDPHSLIANHWQPWSNDAEPFGEVQYWAPRADSGNVYAGEYSQQQYTTYGEQDAGTYQVLDAVVGARYEFSCYVKAWGPVSRVGINPLGLECPLCQSTVWGDGWSVPGWVRVEVETEALATELVVFTRGTADAPVNIYWDACQLRRVQ